jgi:hypothetical protein
MSLVSRIHKMTILGAHPTFFFSKTKYLFVISHMRSRSTLLSHILGSNPGVVGYTELHRPYQSKLDLFKFRARIYIENRKDIDDKYILDKVLHNSYQFSDSVLNLKNAKFLFLIREPKGAIKSLLKISNADDMEYYQDPKNNLTYYQDRLRDVGELAANNNLNSFFIESEDIINEPDKLLKNLSDWLELKEALSTNYSVFDKTGKAGFGDISGNIQSGEIVKTKKNSDITIPPEILNAAMNTYEECKDKLLENCLYK